MNRPLFEQIKEQILAEPKLLNMRFFCRPADKLCNTTGCIAGWAMFLSGLKKTITAAYRAEDSEGSTISQNVDVLAAALLDIPMKEAKELFYFYTKWSELSESPYHELACELRQCREGSKKYAKVVVKAIDLCMSRCSNESLGDLCHD